ncbi:hypothetical protein GV791_16675 [Nocardia cyriacigeorgica]|uniref:Diacylglycerol O-acyltransferase n=1 Tax=Nocardia cyriacigeorgica TaxID=135487 RepID=A0A6P1CNM9_9NOCA|nr:hypothetical protein [Nocardia cyriacigeorgica]NEW34179.1 hypothetical protein [Nocardia cyriacigeorgica]
MSARGGVPARLTVVDEIFLRTHRGLGTPIALQGLWRTSDRVEVELLEDLHARLRRGPLGRRVVRARVPGARRSWRPTVRAHPLDLHGEIAASDVLGWADTLGADLDPEYAPGWRLSSAPLDDGGTVIALTCSHVLADARGLIIAVDTALTAAAGSGAAPTRPPAVHQSPSATSTLAPNPPAPTGHPHTSEQRHHGRRRPAAGLNAVPRSDWADAWEQLLTVLGGTTAAFGTELRRSSSRVRNATRTTDPLATDPRTGDSRTTDPRTPRMPTVGAVLRFPAADWDRAAAASAGTANSLFVWFVANMLWASGFPGATIEAALPVDTRDEPRVDNDLAMTAITVTRADSPGAIRAKARAAYERRMTSPAGLPEETLQLVPDRLAYAMSRGAGERDILCSNIGTLPPSLHTFGPHECTAIAARAIHPDLTFARRPRTRLSGYLSRDRDTYTLALVSLTPELIPNSPALHRLAEVTAGRLGLSLRTW